MMRSGLQSSIIVFGAFATWHLASAGFGLSPELIIEIASTKLNYNPETLDSLVSQRADTLVGVTLFLTTVLMLT